MCPSQSSSLSICGKPQALLSALSPEGTRGVQITTSGRTCRRRRGVSDAPAIADLGAAPTSPPGGVFEHGFHPFSDMGRLASLDVLRAGSGGRTNSLRHWDLERPEAGGVGRTMRSDGTRSCLANVHCDADSARAWSRSINVSIDNAKYLCAVTSAVIE
jgi:hypothetical protein